MKFFRFAFILIAAAMVRLAAESPEFGSPRPLDPSSLSPEWQTLVNQLTAVSAVQAKFIERRWFSFRQHAVELEGQLRYSRAHGLSLRYTEPEEQTVVIDDKGVLFRDSNGRTRSAPSAAVASVRSLLDVMHFDLSALADDFILLGARSGNRWQLELEPRVRAAQRSTARSIVVTGTNHRVETITLILSSRQRIEISIRGARTYRAFTDAQRQKFFR